MKKLLGCLERILTNKRNLTCYVLILHSTVYCGEYPSDETLKQQRLTKKQTRAMDIEHPYKRILLQEENALFTYLITKEDTPLVLYELNEQDKMFVEKRYAFLTSDTGLSILYTVLPLPIEDMILILAYIKDNYKDYSTLENTKRLYSILTSIFKELNQLLIERTAKTYNAIKKNDINLDEKIYSFDTIFSPMPIPKRAEYLYTQLNAFNKIYALANNILQKLLLSYFIITNKDANVNEAFTAYLSEKQMSQLDRTTTFDNFSKAIFDIKDSNLKPLLEKQIFLQSYEELAESKHTQSKAIKKLLLIAAECKNNFINTKVAFTLLSNVLLGQAELLKSKITTEDKKQPEYYIATEKHWALTEKYLTLTELLKAINIHPIFYIIYLEDHLKDPSYIANQQEEIIVLIIDSLEYFFRNEKVINKTNYLDNYRTKLCTIIQKSLPSILAKQPSNQKYYRQAAEQTIKKITASRHTNKEKWINNIESTLSKTQ